MPATKENKGLRYSIARPLSPASAQKKMFGSSLVDFFSLFLDGVAWRGVALDINKHPNQKQHQKIKICIFGGSNYLH